MCFWGWKDNSMVKSTCYSYKKPGFGSMHHENSLLFVTPVPGAPMTSYDLCSTRHTHGTHMYWVSHTDTRKNKSFEKNMKTCSYSMSFVLIKIKPRAQL